MKIEVYTDGSATTKDKPGGYGWVICVDGQFHSEGSGSLPNATNNDAELEAAIMGLGNVYKMIVERPEIIKLDVTLVSDSQIVLGWLSGTYRFKQIAKQEKFAALKRLKIVLGAKGRWVEGHTGDEWNERCDKLAGIERRKAMGIEPKKKSSKSALMLRVIKEIAKLAEFNMKSEDPDQNVRNDWHIVKDRCDQVLGKE